MCPAVWAIVGIQNTTCDDAGDCGHVMSDVMTGRLHADTRTIMHGESWVDELEFEGYAYLSVSLQRMEDFEKMPIAERGLGAVSGGFISWSDSTCSTPFTTEQEWGVIDKSKARCVGVFFSISGVNRFYSTGDCYSGKRLNRVMVCFDRTNAAPVSGFWRNKEVLLGPNIQCDKTNWGRNFKSVTDPGNYMIALEKVTSTVVLKVDFPELSADGDGGIKTVEPELMLAQTFTNGSCATAKDSFILKTTLLDTHEFVFEEGLSVDWSAGWKAKVPLPSEAKTATEVEVSFEAHEPSAISKTQNIDRSAEMSLTPMTGVEATARYMKTVLTVNAVLTVQKTYTNGAIQTWKVPTKYTGVSCGNVDIRLDSVPVGPPSVQ